MGFGERMATCFRIHWNGYFYIFSPLVLLALVFMEPVKEYRAIFLILWLLMWYAIEVMPCGIVAFLPIIALPILGVLSSAQTCMSYTDDPQITLLLVIFVGATIENSNLAKRYAYSLLHHVTLDPKIILIMLMSIAYLLSSFLPAAFVSALMFPVTRQILTMLNDISVCKDVNETIELKDDELPYPSKAAIAMYIGVAYAIDIGSMSTVVSQDAGMVFRTIMENDTCSVALDALKDNLHMKYASISFLMSLLLLFFTMLYLLLIFMGLLRKESPAAQQIAYDKGASRGALDAISGDLPPYDAYMIQAAVYYYLSLIGVVAVALLALEVDGMRVGISACAMFLALVYFVVPRNFDFCNYFKCSKPDEYVTAPSLLPWSLANKMTPWRYIWAFGSTAAIGLTMKDSALHMFVGDNIIDMPDFMLQRLCVICMTMLMTQIGSINYVTEIMIRLSTQITIGENSPASLFYPIIWSSCLTFFLPVSSVANSYASGWGNLRAKHMILASIGPLIFGFILAFGLSTMIGLIDFYK